MVCDGIKRPPGEYWWQADHLLGDQSSQLWCPHEQTEAELGICFLHILYCTNHVALFVV